MPWYAILAMRKTARYNDLLEPRYLPRSPSRDAGRDGRGAGRCSGWMRSSPMRRKKGAPRVKLHVSQDLNWFGRFCFEFYVFLILFVFKCAKGALRLKVSWNQIENGSNSIAKISFFWLVQIPFLLITFLWKDSNGPMAMYRGTSSSCARMQWRPWKAWASPAVSAGSQNLAPEIPEFFLTVVTDHEWSWYIYVDWHKQREHAENLWCTMAWDKPPARLLGQGKQNHGSSLPYQNFCDKTLYCQLWTWFPNGMTLNTRNFHIRYA